MTALCIAKHIAMYRKRKVVTQDELANFLGVTKASVSKWENGQSFPDILLLPQIAAFFDVSIDELLGYSPQLTSQQISKIYQELASEFATQDFEQVIEKSKGYVKDYYACYPFLYQIVMLWINHYMLAKEPKRQKEILEMVLELCNHIHENCKDVALQSNVLTVESIMHLQLGNIQQVIETMEPMFESNQYRLQNDTLLVQAYQMSGNVDQADSHNQFMMYCQLMNFFNSSMLHLILHMSEPSVCETTIARMQALIAVYKLEDLNRNLVLQFYYQAAVFYGKSRNREQTLRYLKLFMSGTLDFLKGELVIHGDGYFNRLDEWLQKLMLINVVPRDRKVIKDSVAQELGHPAFEFINEDPEMLQLIKEFYQ